MSDKYTDPTINVIAPVKSAGSFPIVFADQIAGGLHSVATLTDRDNIPSEDPDNPGKRRKGMLVYVEETQKFYQLKNGITNNDWELAEMGGGADPYKDIVFQLGTELAEGIMSHTEMWLPYTGTIQTVYTSIGVSSTNNSNLLYSIQKYSDTDGWVTLNEFELTVSDIKKEYDVSIPLDSDRIRIVLVSGDYSNVDNMSIIAQFEEEQTATI